MIMTLKEKLYDLKNQRKTLLDTAKALALEGKHEDADYKAKMAEVDKINGQIEAVEALIAQEEKAFAIPQDDPTQKAMVNSVAVYSDTYQKIATYNSTENYVALYGLMQSAIKASSCDDPAKTARQMLEDNGISTTITAQCIGSTKLITGNTVVVHEPQTGTDGLFWILSDSHSFARGIYQTKVTLDFRNLMDKQEAGSVPTK